MSKRRVPDSCLFGLCLVGTLFLFVSGCGILGRRIPRGPEGTAMLIQLAGNADSDEVRLQHLRELQIRPDLDQGLKADLDKVVASIDDWVNGQGKWAAWLNYFWLTKDFSYEISEDSPLYPIVCFYRGRMTVWNI